MVDVPTTADDPTRDFGDGGMSSVVPAAGPASIRPMPSGVGLGGVETVSLLAETLTVSKRRRSTGKVRVAVRTEVTEATAETEVDRYRIEVTRVPVDRVVDEAPAARTEGDTTIVSVVEERLVVVKQLVVVEELRIRHVVERRAVSQPVTLRRQRAVIERLDASGRVVDPVDDRPKAAEHP